jgi:hypothetical protein
MRNYLKYFDVKEEDERNVNGTLILQTLLISIFDFGVVLENHMAYYSGLIFKLTIPAASDDNY